MVSNQFTLFKKPNFFKTIGHFISPSIFFIGHMGSFLKITFMDLLVNNTTDTINRPHYPLYEEFDSFVSDHMIGIDAILLLYHSFCLCVLI